MADATAKDKSPRIRISRTAKGERPLNFADPATEKILGITLSLVSEVSVLRDRLDTIERLIEKHSLFTQTEIDSYELSRDEKAERSARRLKYLDRVLQAVHRDLDEIQTGRISRPLEQIIADFAAGKF